MVTMATRKRAPWVRPQGVQYITRATGRKELDRQARKYLGMSGEEFVRKYRAGEIEDPDRSEVIGLSILMHLAK